jgi:hypothetical protein
MTTDNDIVHEYSVFLFHGKWAVGLNKRGLRVNKYEFATEAEAERCLARLIKDNYANRKQVKINAGKQAELPLIGDRHAGKYRGEMF